MYAVVGCGDCDALWIVADRPETTRCPRCGTRHRFERLKPLAEAETESTARAARARLLAERTGQTDTLEELGGAAGLATAAEAAGVDDAEYLAGSGLDVEAIEAAGEAAERGTRPGGGSRRAVVTAAIETLERPTEAEVLAYATARGVPADRARTILERLLEAGAARRDGDGFRPV